MYGKDGPTFTISIHAPAKGATASRMREGRDKHEFQSTLPRRERRKVCKRLHCGAVISIHAPAKGATESNTTVHLIITISIHAPAKGATIFGMNYLTEEDNFNPRSREGSDDLV